MPRMKILNTAEQKIFDEPPAFNSVQRKQFFDSPKALLETAQTFRKPIHKIGFLVSCGYFNAAKRFFMPKDYHQRDIEYVARHLSVQPDCFDATFYADRTRQRHEHIILEFYGFKRFENQEECFITSEITSMVQMQLKPKLIFMRCVDLLISKRTQIPNFNRLSSLILSTINQRKKDLSSLISTRQVTNLRL